MKLQIRAGNASGELFACDLDAMKMSDILDREEENLPLDDYILDYDMSEYDVETSHVYREE
jgi:hypothetical protein